MLVSCWPYSLKDTLRNIMRAERSSGYGTTREGYCSVEAHEDRHPAGSFLLPFLDLEFVIILQLLF